MDIHVVQRGETLFGIAQQYGITMSRIIADNMLPDPSRLVVGQTLVIRYPAQVHTVRPGETLLAISGQYRLSIRQLQRNNPVLEGGTQLFPGQSIVIRYRENPSVPLWVNGYAYPFINRPLLRRTLPYLS